MYADIRGQGALTLLFVHGFGGAGALWGGQVKYFERTMRVISVDLPGHGRTPWQKETLGDMADQLAGVIDGAGVVKDVVLAASSFGGLAGLELWRRRPLLFRSLVFAGSLPRFTAAADFPAGLDAARIRKLSAQFAGDRALVLDMFYRSLFTPKERESAAYARVKELRAGVPVPSKEALDAFLDILQGTDLRRTLSGVKVPVQFILGDQDYICPLTVAGPLKQILPSARVDVMPGCGHFPFLSYPSEFNGLLQDFIL